MVRKIIIDTDPGIDDAVAIILALRSPELEILGFVAEPGNVMSDRGARNIIRVLDALGAEERLYEKVYVGAKTPLARGLVTGEWVHGSDGLGDAGLAPPSRDTKRGGIEFLVDTVMAFPKGEVTVVSLGPLTNIALAARLQPEVVERINELIMMGGAYGLTLHSTGNVTPVSEYNIFADPEAAKKVFDLFGSKIKAIGLDVTMNPKATLTKDLWRRLASSDAKEAKLVARITKKMIDLFGFAYLHDPITMVAAVKPEFFKFGKFPVIVSTSDDITRGQTIVEKRRWLEPLRDTKTEPFPYIEGPKISIATYIDPESVVGFILKRLMGT